MDEINFKDFQKLDMRVGEIVEVKRVPNTDKLYKIQVDIGKEDTIQTVSSLVDYYNEEELMNKRVVILVNLKNTKFCGEVSEGMLLASETEDESECVLLTPEKDIKLGSKVL